MGALEPVDLPETPLIIGDRWPQPDETAYAREAATQRSCAQAMCAAADHTHTAVSYTHPEFRGAAGGALGTLLGDRHQAHTDDETRHNNIAGWLELASTNIAEAKNAMNTTTVEYHRAYADSERCAVEETWSQQQLAGVKTALVQNAQARIGEIRAAFDASHATIAAGIAAACVPAAPEEMKVYRTSSTLA
ncbi:MULTISPECIES: hypothetical protein [Mycolicibacter]|uniref:Uncharacterized protein n=2 Tax=Mycolicibacter TaxID=1073531 RepID=A0ABU5XL16_9MYCO|nr:MULTISPECIES: hypothetical protein [unclassified Mycolicibacter]MEB3022975.1 hypothetical protein [Mycolicibacter sp. MYC098]MEB3033485.1 hypothetical protein [Mycolicibacter sp. MYC340]